MNVEYSKPFLKAVDKLSGKVLSSVLDMIREVKNANGIDEITNCKKVKFEYLVSRGEAYDKKVQSELRKKDK